MVGHWGIAPTGDKLRRMLRLLVIEILGKGETEIDMRCLALAFLGWLIWLPDFFLASGFLIQILSRIYVAMLFYFRRGV